MPATTDYSTGFGRHEIYRLQQASTEGSVQVYSSGTKAIFAEGAKQEMKAGSTLDVESGALLNLAGIQRIPSGGEIEMKAASTMNVESGAAINVYGKLTAKSGGEIELEAGSTMNVESGAHVNIHAGGVLKASSGAYVEQRGIRTYTCTTAKLNIYDRVSILYSSNKWEWTLGPPGTHLGLVKTIIFQSKKSDGKDLALNCTHKTINFGTTSIHNIIAGATNPHLLSATGNVSPLSVELYAQSSASWLILTNLSTDKDVGKLQATSSTGFF